jgi:hypothetical protein
MNDNAQTCDCLMTHYYPSYTYLGYYYSGYSLKSCQDNCCGGGISSGGSGSFRGSGYSDLCKNVNHSTMEEIYYCSSVYVIMLSALGGLIGFSLLFVTIYFCYKRHRTGIIVPTLDP